MNILVYIVLYGWIPAVLWMFSAMPPRRAVLVASIASWLFLPVVSFRIPGLPDYTKMSAMTVGLLLGTALYGREWMSGLRLRWFDLPMLAWCLAPFASSMANGLGPYDGLSCALEQTVAWGLPYLIGRIYFGDLDGQRALAVAIVAGGLIYTPLCLYEIRMSPQLHRTFYGFHPAPFGMAIRWGGFRPTVFMSHGLEVGMWMTTALLVGYWLWATGNLRELRGRTFGPLLLTLLVTTVLCKSTGSTILLAVGIAVLWLVGRTGSSLAAWALVLAAPLYMEVRATNQWKTADAVAQVEALVGYERAESFQGRLLNEDLLVSRALLRPAFGWGGWGRNLAHTEDGETVGITDGLWVIAIGKYGLVGLVSLTASMLLPVVLLLWRHPPRSWRDPEVAPAAVLAVALGLFMVDCVSNAMLNPIFLLACGGLTGLARRCGGSGCPDPGSSIAEGSPDDPERRRGLAIAQGELALYLRDRGYPREAEAAWVEASGLWADLAADFPEEPEFLRRCLDARNDLAWSLAHDPDPAARDPIRATRLAEEAVAMAPECATYWNTLGAARYRSGDWEGAIAALETSVGLGPGGTAFDHLFLAVAHHRLARGELARAWFGRAEAWSAAHPAARGELLPFRAEAAADLGAPDAAAAVSNPRSPCSES